MQSRVDSHLAMGDRCSTGCCLMIVVGEESMFGAAKLLRFKGNDKDVALVCDPAGNNFCMRVAGEGRL